MLIKVQTFIITRPTFGTNRAWTDKSYTELSYRSPCNSIECVGPTSYKFGEWLSSSFNTKECHLYKRKYCSVKDGITPVTDPGCYPSQLEFKIKTISTELSSTQNQFSVVFIGLYI